MLKAGIINVSSYLGNELVRLLLNHPEVQITSVSGRSAAGKPLGDAFPHHARLSLMVSEQVDEDVDVVFSALPQTASAEQCLPFIRRGVPVIDLSADFRLKEH